jgi:hypothetical protein
MQFYKPKLLQPLHSPLKRTRQNPPSPAWLHLLQNDKHPFLNLVTTDSLLPHDCRVMPQRYHDQHLHFGQFLQDFYCFGLVNFIERLTNMLNAYLARAVILNFPLFSALLHSPLRDLQRPANIARVQ